MLRTVPRQARALQVTCRKKSARSGRRISDPDYHFKESKVFPKLETGDKLGPGDRYKILNGDPLRWFPKYSLWLAHNERENKDVIVEAVKSEDIGACEFSAYEHLSSRPPAIGFGSTHLKRILLHVLRGIAHMHSCGIVHTDINPETVLFDAGRLDIDNIVRNPYPYISNLGEAKFADEDYRLPEIILQNPWNEKVDIWAFGCLIFELSASQTLFRHLTHSLYVEDPNESHLWQIQRITGENFGLRQLKASPNTGLSDPPSYRETFTECLEIYNVLKKSDVDITTALLEQCLHVNLEDRPTAEELLKDPFWEDL
ncbi:hypothetical protein Clacol_008577 [Clathrus columnatus]|uniref:Protein kinase domain-containing protein n=1 Tax=Clathrus columnatus TaxID=1419009 RepID=A0AAV5ALG8_9AGAM|nr:hypothetical protein Clacol_008577 [Clathrus columnatus]